MLEESFLSNSVISLFTDEEIEDQEIKLCVLCRFNFLKDLLTVGPKVGMYLQLLFVPVRSVIARGPVVAHS